MDSSPATRPRAALLAALLSACAAPAGVERALPAVLQDPPSAPPALVDTADGADWLRLDSGEWIRGEVVVLDRDTLEFDSDGLGLQKIAWDDVAELRSGRLCTVVLEGRVEAVGTVRVLDDRLWLAGEEGTRELARADVFRMVPGRPREANFWSGRYALGATARSGNTDQLDVSSSLSLLRRTARSRLPLSYEAAYAELEGERSADNHRLRAQYDRFLAKRLYVTPLGLELYRDRFQNLALRALPFAGLGYQLADAGDVAWSANAGLGYRYTRYDSVEPGEASTEESSTALAGTAVSWSPTATVDVDLGYSLQVGLEDASQTNHSATLALAVDLWWDFDLDLRLRWDRVGAPQADDDGALPEKDDFRLTVGLGGSF